MKFSIDRFAVLVLIAFSPMVSVMAGEDSIQCANLIYAGTHTSRCFSDEFLNMMERETNIATERRFRSVKLASDELFQYPFVVMTGESDFMLSKKERTNLKQYLESGGFLLASAGCSSKEWDQAFRRQMKILFGDNKLEELAMDHPIFNSFYGIQEIELKHEAPGAALLGLEVDGRVVMVYSPHGLNDTAHTEGCCCCGGNEIRNSLQVNINILVYALIH